MIGVESRLKIGRGWNLEIGFGMWGRMASCGGLAIRLSGLPSSCREQTASSVCGARPIANRPQVANLPHIPRPYGTT